MLTCVWQNVNTIPIGVREGILPEEAEKFALKITICPKNKHLP